MHEISTSNTYHSATGYWESREGAQYIHDRIVFYAFYVNGNQSPISDDIYCRF